MEISKIYEIEEESKKVVSLAHDYLVNRKVAGETKSDLDVLLAAEIITLRKKKPNIGYEMALIMLMADNPEARELYKKHIIHESNYKAIEKLIDAMQSKISLFQSILKYIEKGGG